MVLVGLMGSGKTTVGKKVAKLVGRRFLDGDAEIEARTGRSVAAWFTSEGEAAFRDAEGVVLSQVLEESEVEPLIFGAGGGVVIPPANRSLLTGPGVTVVYLHAEPGFLASRAQAKPHRPLLTGDPVPVLERMYAERDGWYREVADAVIEVRPAHEAGQRPKWRLAEQVVEALVECGAVDPSEVVDPSLFDPSDVPDPSDASDPSTGDADVILATEASEQVDVTEATGGTGS